MLTLAFLLLGLGLLVLLVGAILMLVAAFRESILWGLGSFFVPFVQYIFVIAHWAEAKTGFLMHVVGLLLMGGGTLALVNAGETKMIADKFSEATGGKFAFAGGDNAGSTEDQRAAKEAEIRDTETQIATFNAKVSADYAALSAQRAKLGNDQAVIAAFNQQAAAYQTAKGQLDALNAKLVKLKAEEAELTQQVLAEAREAAKNPKKAGAAKPASGFSLKAPLDKTRAVTKQVAQGDVVMYTTQRCPACVAAKNYMNKNGIPYREIDVERDAAGMAEFKRRGGTGVPLIVVKGKQMTGFSPQALDAML